VPPGQEFSADARVVLFQQRVGREVRRLAQRRAEAVACLGRDGRADDRRDHFAEQAHRPLGRVFRPAVAQRDIELRVVQFDQRVARADADVDVRMLALERLQPRDQPQRRERRERRQADMAAAARQADLPHRRVEPVQQRRDAAQQRGAGTGELHVPGAAQEQRRADFVFQAADLPADGRLRDMQLLRGGTEAGTPRHRLEGPDRAHRQRAATHSVHDDLE
jgi:hypothetical protein